MYNAFIMISDILILLWREDDSIHPQWYQVFRFSVNLKFVFEIIFKINVVAEGQQFETLDFQ